MFVRLCSSVSSPLSVRVSVCVHGCLIHLPCCVTPAGEPSTFGDVALMSDDCIRTASVIVDEPSDFIVFDRDLYNRSVKSVLKKEFEDKTNFIDRSHYFRSWQPRFRQQLAMAMVKETVPFNSELTRQGNPVDTIYFLLA